MDRNLNFTPQSISNNGIQPQIIFQSTQKPNLNYDMTQNPRIMYSQQRPITIGFDHRQNILDSELKSQSTMKPSYVDSKFQELNRQAQSTYLQQQFDDRQSTISKRQDKLCLDQAVIYEDGRSHYVFNDKTGMILHPRGDCVTYFSQDGKKVRQLVKYAVKSISRDERGIGLLDKLIIAVQFYNTFGDEPIITRDELIRNEEGGNQQYQRVTKFNKITQIIWPGTENIQDYISLDQDENLHLKSVYDDAELVLSSNGFQFTVTYLYLLPYKKPAWTQANETSSTIKNLVSTKKDERRMKMAYEYVRITQIFSISRFPDFWCYPVSLILHYKQSLLQSQKECEYVELAFNPFYCNKFHQVNSRDCCYQELIRNKEYSTELPQCHRIITDETEEDRSKSRVLSNTFDANQSQMTSSSKMVSPSKWDNESSVSQYQKGHDNIKVWSQDEISPVSYLYTNKKNILLQWNSQCTTRMFPYGDQAEVFIHQDDSVVYLKEKGKFLVHYKENLMDGGMLRSFTCDTVPFTVNDSKDYKNKPQIHMQEIIADAFVVQQQPFEISERYLKPDQEKEADQKLKLMASEQNIVYKELSMPGLATFYAYTNRSVKAAFEDRTIVRMIEGCDSIRILNRRGEEITLNIGKPNILYNDYKNYITVSEEFFDWAFSTLEQKQRKQEEQERQRQLIELEMSKIQRTLYFIDEQKGQELIRQNELQETLQQQQIQQLQQQQELQESADIDIGYNGMNYGMSHNNDHALKEIEVNAQKINEINELLSKLKQI